MCGQVWPRGELLGLSAAARVVLSYAGAREVAMVSPPLGLGTPHDSLIKGGSRWRFRRPLALPQAISEGGVAELRPVGVCTLGVCSFP